MYRLLNGIWQSLNNLRVRDNVQLQFGDDGDAVVTFNGTDLNVTGSRTVLPASTAGRSGVNIPEGAAPSAPANGDLWVTTTDIVARINGVSESLLGGGAATNSFETISVIDAEPSPAFSWAATGDVVAASPTDTLTILGGAGIDIDVDTAGDAIRVTATLDTLGELTDVDLTAAADGDLLYRSAGNWIDSAGGITYDGSIFEAVNKTIRISDGASPLSYADAAHDGLDLNWNFVGTAAINVTGLTSALVLDDAQLILDARGSGAAQSAILQYADNTSTRNIWQLLDHAGVSLWQQFVSAADDIYWYDDVNNKIFLHFIQNSDVRVRDGIAFRVYGPGDANYGQLAHDDTNLTLSGVGGTPNLNISGFTSIQAGAIAADFDALTATSYGGITEANLVDKAAAETISGDWTYSGRVVTDDSTASRAGFNIPTGVAPSTPVQGDIWVTATDIIARINGVNESLISGGGASNSFETHTVTDTDSGFTWAETGSAVAASSSDTLTWVSGVGIDLDVDAASDAIRVALNAALNDISDVNITTPADASMLLYDTTSGEWRDAAMSGDATIDDVGALTIANNAVTLAKMADMATDSFIGRDTAGSGDPEVLSAATARSVLNVADGANNYSHPNHTGDVTSVGDGAQTIANDVVSNAKLANMAQSTIKGRAVAAGTGDPTDLTAAQATAILDAFTSALQGVVPASGGGTAAYLRADGTWTSAMTATSYAGIASANLLDKTATETISGAWTVSNDLFTVDGFRCQEDWRLTGVVTDSITANQNNYAPTGHAEASILQIDADGNYNITGIQGGVQGRMLYIFNADTTNTITLTDNDTNSSAANRMLLPSSSNFTIQPESCVVLIYLSISDFSRWRMLASA